MKRELRKKDSEVVTPLLVTVNLLLLCATDTESENGIENGMGHYTVTSNCTLHIFCVCFHTDMILCDVQETKQKQDAKRQLDIERKQAEASDEELKRKLEELKKQLQEKDAQVMMT